MLTSFQSKEDAMKHLVAATAIAVTLAQPAAGITFPSLTTIYVGSGVYEFDNVATIVHCSNVSAVTTQIRVLVLNGSGAVAASDTRVLQHGQSLSFSTGHTAGFGGINIQTGVLQGLVNIESLQSAVFCTAHHADKTAFGPSAGTAIHLVRINPHPGTVE
jgi:hypothetical protein